ncbi:Probable DNA-directed RNA polymerases I and III subunit RPAC2 [Gryllus bimaculatus]|nr:Probable DNA-directed RNA polymerases I and III subunit RPAC2 [Gryllus bimaculatus]
MALTKSIAELAGDKKSDEKARTFVLENHGHTLGNALRSIVMGYPEVDFCGYSVPHPAENKMHFRIQTKGPRATDILQRGLEDLVKVCDAIEEQFKSEMESFQASNL